MLALAEWWAVVLFLASFALTSVLMRTFRMTVWPDVGLARFMTFEDDAGTCYRYALVECRCDASSSGGEVD
jgi:hypothetical protein